MSIARPQNDEFAPYYLTYINKVADGNVLAMLESQIGEFHRALDSLAEDRALFRYAPGKWSTKEVVGHVIDSERVFAYRAMRIARADTTPLPGFDENQFVANATFDSRSLRDLVAEYEHVRLANLDFFRSLSPEAAARRGTANNLSISVRAIVYITAGHSAHHLGILREKYL